MKSIKVMFCATALSVALSMSAQVNVQEEVADSIVVSNERIYTAVEENPKFPGGDAEMYKFLARNLRYPQDALANNVKGKVRVQFVIEKDGSISSAKVIAPVYESLDKEAVRVVKSMPKWTPGKMNGQPVRVYYTLPVSFNFKG